MEEALVMSTGNQTSLTLKCIHLQTGVQADWFESWRAINQTEKRETEMGGERNGMGCDTLVGATVNEFPDTALEFLVVENIS